MDRNILALKAMADDRPFRPRGAGTVVPGPEVEEVAVYQQLPVPTAFAGDFDEVAKAAEKSTAEELAEKVEAMAREEGKDLLRPNFVDLTLTPAPAPPQSIVQRVSLSSSDCSSSSSSSAVSDHEPAAASEVALAAARNALWHVMEGPEAAKEALAAAMRAATEQMEQLD